MSKLSREEIAAIVKKHGFRVVPQQRTDVRQAQVDGRTPELSTLKAKYARGTKARAADDREAPALNGDNSREDDDMIVLVEPETKRDALTRANRPKAKVISGKKKDFTGSQG